MRLVTWNIDHLDADHSPDRIVAALSALEPDIAILTGLVPGPARDALLPALASVGLAYRLAPDPGRRNGHALAASRLELLPGSLGDAANRERTPANVMHAFAPTGLLDVLEISVPDRASRPAGLRKCWDWLLQAATTLKHRRAVLVGTFGPDAANDDAILDPMRRLADEGWHHAMPALGAVHSGAARETAWLDHAFLSPSLQRIDARYALEAAGLRLAGTKDSPSERPALVVDLQ